MRVGDRLLVGRERFVVLEILKDDLIRIMPFSEKGVYHKAWSAISVKHDDPIESIIEWYYTMRKANGLTIPKRRNKATEKNTIRLCIEKDGYDINALVDILSFSLSNNFWSTVGLQSLSQLRKKNPRSSCENDDRTKIEKINDSYIEYLKKIEYKNYMQDREK